MIFKKSKKEKGVGRKVEKKINTDDEIFKLEQRRMEVDKKTKNLEVENEVTQEDLARRTERITAQISRVEDLDPMDVLKKHKVLIEIDIKEAEEKFQLQKEEVLEEKKLLKETDRKQARLLNAELKKLSIEHERHIKMSENALSTVSDKLESKKSVSRADLVDFLEDMADRYGNLAIKSITEIDDQRKKWNKEKTKIAKKISKLLSQKVVGTTDTETKDFLKKVVKYYLITFSVIVVLFFFGKIDFGKQIDINTGKILFLVLITHIVISFKIVGPDKIGAILFFGKPIINVSSGIVFVPKFICSLEINKGTTIQKELPGEPEDIFRNEDTQEIPKGKVPPTRITFARAPRPKEPLEDRSTTEVSSFVRYKIVNMVDFVKVFGVGPEALERLEAQIGDSTEAMLTRELTKITVAKAFRMLGTYNAELEEAIRDRISGDAMSRNWGVYLEQAQIKSILFSHKLNIAMRQLPEAKYNAEVMKVLSYAKKTEAEQIGIGEALGEKAKILERTKGFEIMKKTLNTSIENVFSSEMAISLAKGTTKHTILGARGGTLDLLSAFAGASDVFQQQNTSSENKDKETISTNTATEDMEKQLDEIE